MTKAAPGCSATHRLRKISRCRSCRTMTGATREQPGISLAMAPLRSTTLSQHYSFTANLSVDGQTLTGGIVGKVAAHIQVKLNAPQVASACKKLAPTPSPPPPAALVRVYPLPAHVTKVPLGVGGPIGIDAGLAVSSARSLTAPFGDKGNWA